MDLKIIWRIIRERLCERRILFASLALILAGETFLSLLVPEVMRIFIDSLGNRGTGWLVLCALGYCLAVLLKGGMSVLNGWLGEKAGWRNVLEVVGVQYAGSNWISTLLEPSKTVIIQYETQELNRLINGSGAAAATSKAQAKRP